jgi:arsenite/tail-anchored protein-transporting ATPase
MRIILYTGKGGVGKTTLSAATGVELAARGHRTLVMSVDPAHSLSDSFDLHRDLMDDAEGQAVKVADKLWIREIDVHEQMSRNWGDIESYASSVIIKSGMQPLVADELAIFPGMEEVTALLCLKEHVEGGKFDVILLDCAPTAESLRFVAVPSVLAWYMKKVFGLERKFAAFARSVRGKTSSATVPAASYFANLEELDSRLRGVDALLTDPRVTTVRLVTNPETVVVRETQRAYTYFCLSGLTVDAVIVNRVLPPEVKASFFSTWRSVQEQWVRNVDEYFAPTRVFQAPLFRDEVFGLERLRVLGPAAYKGVDPIDSLTTRAPYRFRKRGKDYEIDVLAPFVTPKDVEVYKSDDELIISIGNAKRHLLLPTRIAACDRVAASICDGRLTVVLGRRNGPRRD